MIKNNRSQGGAPYKKGRHQHKIVYERLQEGEVSEKELKSNGVLSPAACISRIEKQFDVEVKRRSVKRKVNPFGFQKSTEVFYSLGESK